MSTCLFPASAAVRLPLSVCMIVRDEADRLAHALASVRDVAGELIVVDTGSSDATVAIAESFGARVLHFDWVDDFARARNVALAAASQDWILSLDADQCLAPEAGAALAHATRRGDCLAQLVTIDLHGAMPDDARAPDAALSTYTGLRLFRRDPRIRYRGRVHEDIADSLLAAGSAHWPESGVRLADRGYADPADRARKRARNLALLRRSHAERPDELYASYKLAITLPSQEIAGRRRLLERALVQARSLPARDLRGLAFLPRLVALAVGEWVDQGRLVEAADACTELHGHLGSPLAYTTGAALARAGRLEAAREHLQAFLAEPGEARDAALLRDDDATPVAACRWLAWIERRRGAPVQALDWLRRAGELADDDRHGELACDEIELQLDAGELAGAARALDAASALVHGRPPALAALMRASARLAQASGDPATARQLARAALRAGDDDDGALLLATLEIDAGPIAPQRLREHWQAIAGRRFDTLAVKLMIGAHLGLAWDHAVPPATREALRLG